MSCYYTIDLVATLRPEHADQGKHLTEKIRTILHEVDFDEAEYGFDGDRIWVEGAGELFSEGPGELETRLKELLIPLVEPTYFESGIDDEKAIDYLCPPDQIDAVHSQWAVDEISDMLLDVRTIDRLRVIEELVVRRRNYLLKDTRDPDDTRPTHPPTDGRTTPQPSPDGKGQAAAVGS